MRDISITNEEKRAQGKRCGCRGSDDLCPCQNTPDQVTRRERAARKIAEALASTKQREATMSTQPQDREFDEEAFDEALEAYWSADGGTYGGVRAAIRKYNELVAARETAATATKTAEVA